MGVFWLWGTKFSKGKNYDKEIQALDDQVTQIKEEYARKDSANTFTQNQTIKSIVVGENETNNYFKIHKFEYQGSNILGIEGKTTSNENVLQITANLTSKQAFIRGNANGGLKIEQLNNPVNEKDATNKQYVDSGLRQKVSYDNMSRFLGYRQSYPSSDPDINNSTAIYIKNDTEDNKIMVLAHKLSQNRLFVQTNDTNKFEIANKNSVDSQIQQVNTQLSNKANTSELNTKIQQVNNQIQEINNKLNNKVSAHNIQTNVKKVVEGLTWNGKTVYSVAFEFRNVTAEVTDILRTASTKIYIVSVTGFGTGYYRSTEYQQLPFSGSGSDTVAVRVKTNGDLYLYKKWSDTVGHVYGTIYFTEG